MSKTPKEQPAQKPIDELSDEEMQKLLLRSQLRTQLMLEQQAEHTATKFETDTRTKEQKAASAQRDLEVTSNRLAGQKDLCRHKQGGFGLEGTFKGKGEPSLIMATTCLPGHKVITCYRCDGKWETPQPSLKRTDPKEHARQLKEFQAIEEMYLESTSSTMASPNFTFEKDGIPYAPDRV